MISNIREFFSSIFKSRTTVLFTALLLMFSLILGRVFVLQIIMGQSYQDNFVMRIEKTLPKEATRGNIYDCNGKLLAYNELAYSITISDNGSYKNTTERNNVLNAQLAEIVEMLDRNGDSLYNNFQIARNEDGSYSYKISGSQLKRFLADIFGAKSYSDLEYNEEYGFHEAYATAEDVIRYLSTNKHWYMISQDYSPKTIYEIIVIRYAMSSTIYSRYKTTTIATNISDKSVAYINEHSDELFGVSIEETTIRKYNDSIYFASIIGYTGKISDAEYATLSKEDESYTREDTVGKSGLEQYYESFLRGQNGEQVVYVDTVGRVQQIVSSSEPVAGDDLYITIDSTLQKNVYKLLEQEIAGIVYSNIKSGNISSNDLYYALINNNVVDITKFDKEDASVTEKLVYQNFLKQQSEALNLLKTEFYTSQPIVNNDMSEELLDYVTYVINLLKNDKLLVTSKIDTSDSVYIKWKDGKLSPQDYFKYGIAEKWIDSSLLDIDSKYADTTEIYNALIDYILAEAAKDKDFSKYVYKYMVQKGEITGQQIALILLDQHVLSYDEKTYQNIQSGALSAYTYILDKINNIEITPAQLALDPCTGSCVITDVTTGEVKALVSYPGYDNNKLANGVDPEYYAKLNDDKSNPQWNYATQEKTAPGSTFKMVTSIAGLAENTLTPTSKINCTGIFEEVDNKPKCHAYPNNHGYLNVSEAIRDSCNLFYYTTGYNLALKDTGIYNDKNGIDYINEYASILGLSEKSGLEIAESKSSIATEYPVMAAIGQSNNNITTVALSRYVTAISSGKLYDYKLMSKIVDYNGNTVVSYKSTYTDISNTLSDEKWHSVRYGMNLMALNYATLQNFEIKIAGKTGTAQQVKNRPNHALFVGYAPYEEPKISIATRIAYGYAASNAVSASRNILAVYFGLNTVEEILNLKAEGVNSSLSNIITD